MNVDNERVTLLKRLTAGVDGQFWYEEHVQSVGIWGLYPSLVIYKYWYRQQ